MFYKLQFVGEPIQVNKPNVTELQILFDSPRILIEKEELAYSSLTLVSDVGGVLWVLGLFIGFNFLMIWDVFHQVYRKMKKKLELIYNT